MSHTFITPNKVITGVDCFDELGRESAGLGTRALLVTGKTAIKAAGIAGRAVSLLRDQSVDSVLFAEAEPEPDILTVDAGRKACGDGGCDLVVGIGGGSALDVAKAIAGLANEPAPTEEYHEGREIKEDGLPCVAVPTTSGTGTEVTKNSVLTNGRRKVKKSIRADSMVPPVAIVDPRLTVTMPPHITAHTGLDALTQAIESFLSKNATPLTEGLSLHAVRLICASLEQAVQDGDDLRARESMSYGSLMAGLALANARLGVVHGIAHPLGARYGIPHGLVCGILLPPAMRLNSTVSREKLDLISQIVGQDAITFVEGLLERVGVPADLREYNLAEEDFPAIVAESMPSGSLKANPKTVAEQDVLEILKQVMG